MNEFRARLIIIVASVLAGAIVIYGISGEILPVFVAIGVCVAVFGIRMARKTVQQQETLKFMNKFFDSKKMSEGFDALKAVNADIENIQRDNASEGVIRELVEERTRNPGGKEAKKLESIFVVLSKMEMLSVGLKHKIYDQEMVIDFFWHDVGRLYELSAPLIHHIRKYDSDPEAYVEFEEFARRIKSGDKAAG